MLTLVQFVQAVKAGVPRLAANWLDAEQEIAVNESRDQPLFIVAGPGAGKTTVLALRVLKLILVDGIAPSKVVATTFTRKAADELRSRILSWGYGAITAASRLFTDPNTQPFLRALDINRVIVGTLDSIAEQALLDNRPPGTITPATIEGFLSKGFLRKYAFFTNGRFRDPQLQAHLSTLARHFPHATTFASKLNLVMQYVDRARHDYVDLTRYAARGDGPRILCDTAQDYFAFLQEHHLADFGRLEWLFLERLRGGDLGRFVASLDALLVDEFQDTNYLQEQIYLELCRQSGASLTVVGDDDQSIYRFRGATVEIFASFQQRIVESLGNDWTAQRVDLFRNYRSTKRIVAFCDVFVIADPSYRSARVPGKIRLVAQAARSGNLPVLGMFRPDCQTLAADLSALLVDIFRGNGRIVQTLRDEMHISRSASGDFGDAVLLSRSVAERAWNGRERLPLLMRAALANANVRVFNPRGRSMGDILDVQTLLGLTLECIDPGGRLQLGIVSLPNNVRTQFDRWRTAAQQLTNAAMPPAGLLRFVRDWQTRNASSGQIWPREWPLLELVFTLASWFPFLQRDPEGQVYLEAVARTVNEVGQLGTFRARVLRGTQWDDPAIVEILRTVFEPIADESIDVDEEIMPQVPRAFVPMMTVHQAKGLEFPLVIVDVGSDFRTNHHTQRPFRFPTEGGNVHWAEDDVAPFSPVGPLRLQRSPRDRAWDDLRRLYFVGYSRAHDVLILAGLMSQIRQQPVPGVATGDLFDGTRTLTFVAAEQWDSAAPDAASSVALI